MEAAPTAPTGDTEEHLMVVTHPTGEATGATVEATHPTEATGDMDMARDLLSLNLVTATLVMAILATGVMEVMEVMERLTDLMEVVDTDTIKREHCCTQNLHIV